MINIITVEEDKIIEAKIKEYEKKYGIIEPTESRKSLYYSLLDCLREYNKLPEVDQIRRNEE